MLSEKLSISLPMSLANFIDHYQHTHSCKNRSEVIQKAIKLLQEQELAHHYQLAVKEDREIIKAFDTTTTDGIDDETW